MFSIFGWQATALVDQGPHRLCKGAMPSRKKTGIPGRCSLPSDYVHPQQSFFQFPAAMGLPMMAGPAAMSLGQLGQPAPLALTYPGAGSQPSRAGTVSNKSHLGSTYLESCYCTAFPTPTASKNFGKQRCFPCFISLRPRGC